MTNIVMGDQLDEIHATYWNNVYVYFAMKYCHECWNLNETTTHICYNICNIVKLQCPIVFLQGMRNSVRFTVNVGDSTDGLQLVLSKTNRIGNTKYSSFSVLH